MNVWVRRSGSTLVLTGLTLLYGKFIFDGVVAPLAKRIGETFDFRRDQF